MRLPMHLPPVFVAALAAACLPSLLAFNVSPSPTFLNQALAFAGWGLVAWTIARWHDGPGLSVSDLRRAAPAWLALALVTLAAAWSSLAGALPSSLALSAIGTLLAAMVLLAAGIVASHRAAVSVVFAAFCLAWVVAGVANAGVAIVQVFAPSWADGDWIARSGIPGRAVGNLRQPNHLSSLLMWSAIAVIGCLELRRLSARVAAALMALLVFTVVLTASRTGVIGVVILALWAVVDRRLGQASRRTLLAAPLLYALAWAAMAAWAAAAQATFGGQARLAEPDLSASRFAIWADTLALIRAQPWTGVGFGEFNLAWTLSVMPHRPVAFFDHSHNLPLQLAVELGVPLALLVMGGLLAGLWRGFGTARRAVGDSGVATRCGLTMLVMIGLHSLLEYPLWYSYFLLPTAWIFGLVLGVPATAEPMPSGETRNGRPVWLIVPALAVIAGALASVVDYARVVAIFSAGDGAPPLQARIDRGRQSVLFAHHADYAAATVAERPGDELAAFGRAAHYLLDTRLLMGWARALDEAGDRERARHLAQRLREFRNPQSAAFLGECAAQQTDDQATRPFQCAPPTASLAWRDFLPR
jgi:O-antigen ligase